MKLFFLVLFAAQFVFAADPSKEISGTVTISKDAESALTATGALFIIARPAGVAKPGTPPVGALRIPQPKFPLKFSIGPENSMMGGKFDGDITITARYSATGDALDKSGPEGTDPKNLKAKLGKLGLKIELKPKK